MQRDSGIRTFEGATAVVTGGASGIGRALAEALARNGSDVFLGDLQTALADEVASGICAFGGKAQAVHVDVTDFAAVERLAQKALERTGRLDYLFNNVGIAIGGNVSHYGIADWNQMVDVNLRGIIHGVHAAYRIMRDQGFGHIVNTASMAGLMPAPGAVAYAATKYAVVGLSESLRAEAAHAGVRVSVVCPGVVRTPILEGGGRYGKMLIEVPPEKSRELWERWKPMAPDVFAPQVLRRVAKNRAIIVVPSWWRLFWWFHRLCPPASLYLAQRSFRKLQDELGLA